MCGAQMVIKCADIGHLAADHNIHKRWSYKLEEEFFRQVQPPKPIHSSWPLLHEEATPALWCPLLTINSACMRLMLSKTVSLSISLPWAWTCDCTMRCWLFAVVHGG